MPDYSVVTVAKQIPPAALSKRNAAKFIAISERTLDGLVIAGEIVPVRLPGKHLYVVDDLRAWLERAKQPAEVTG